MYDLHLALESSMNGSKEYCIYSDSNKKYEMLSDMENNTPCSHPPMGYTTSSCIKSEVENPVRVNGVQPKVFTESNCNEGKAGNFEDYERFQSDRITQVYSFLYPRYVQNVNPTLGFHPHKNLCSNPGSMVAQQFKKEKQDPPESLRFQLPWEFERKKEQNKKRKALHRAQETEEQRRLRRERDRLKKAQLRAREPLEKRMLRRERDRIAKAISRASESEEQRRTRREKNRRAMAALRASQSEEERSIRREKDRIKKATMRAYETEEQKKFRREKNRIAMATKRANFNEEQRNQFRYYNRLIKASNRSRKKAEEKKLLLSKMNLDRVREKDPQELPNFKETYSEKCIERLQKLGVDIEIKKENHMWEQGKVLVYNPSTSHQSTSFPCSNQNVFES